LGFGVLPDSPRMSTTTNHPEQHATRRCRWWPTSEGDNGTSARREAARYPHLQGGPGVIELHLITNTPVRHTEVTTVRCPVRRQDAAVCAANGQQGCWWVTEPV
jgi:hypothetical protein